MNNIKYKSYLIVTEAEYTKHYYAESQRIASKLGGGWANALVDPLNDHLPETPNFYYNELNSKLEVGLGKRAECVGMEWNNVIVQDGFTAIDDQYGVSDPEINQYFYHPDHLGSSSFITNASGNVDQHLQYLPFGEPWIDQRTSNNIRFTFSGKERDDETGYNYFGARYYNADISIWLSIDPLSDQYPSHSGYNYVMNNPIKLVDPTGMSAETYEIDESGYIQLLDKTKYYREENGSITTISEGEQYNGHGTPVDKLQSKSNSSSSMYTPKITMKSKTTVNYTAKARTQVGLMKKENYNLDAYSFENSEDAREFFEFVSTVSKNAEWGNTKIDLGGGITQNKVGTIHEPDKSGLLGYLDKTGYKIIQSDHSHPDFSDVHKDDANIIWKLDPKNQNAIFRIYHPSKGYKEYNKFYGN